MARQQRLEALLLAALKQAMRGDRLDIAEHILAALEMLDAENERQASFFRQTFGGSDA